MLFQKRKLGVFRKESLRACEEKSDFEELVNNIPSSNVLYFKIEKEHGFLITNCLNFVLDILSIHGLGQISWSSIVFKIVTSLLFRSCTFHYKPDHASGNSVQILKGVV